MIVIQAHQGSCFSYEELCQPVLERVYFLLTQVQSAGFNADYMLMRRHMQTAASRWQVAIRRVIAGLRSGAGMSVPSLVPDTDKDIESAFKVGECTARTSSPVLEDRLSHSSTPDAAEKDQECFVKEEDAPSALVSPTGSTLSDGKVCTVYLLYCHK